MGWNGGRRMKAHDWVIAMVFVSWATYLFCKLGGEVTRMVAKLGEISDTLVNVNAALQRIAGTM